MFRRTLPEGFSRRLLDRLANRLIKIITESANSTHHKNKQRLAG
jgi:hypothetical protein